MYNIPVKNLLLAVSFFVLLNFISRGQDKIYEVNIGTRNLSSFSLKYKFGNENRLFRVSTTHLSYQNDKLNGSEETSGYMNLGLKLGMEFPKWTVKRKVEYYYGFEFGGEFSRQFEQDSNNYTLLANPVLGVSYYFNRVLKLSVELSHGFYYQFSEFNEGNSKKDYGFNLSNGLAEIQLGFRF